MGEKQCDTNQWTESTDGQNRIFTDNFYCRGALADVVNINWSIITRPFQICKVDVYGTAIGKLKSIIFVVTFRDCPAAIYKANVNGISNTARTIKNWLIKNESSVST